MAHSSWYLSQLLHYRVSDKPQTTGNKLLCIHYFFLVIDTFHMYRIKITGDKFFT
jgi:hypothetical protein